MYVDYNIIKQTALNQADSLLHHLFPGGKRSGNEYVVLNLTRNDSTPGSFKVNLTTGVWCDFATDDKGGDLISLWDYRYRIGDYHTAAIKLAKHLGITPETPPPFQSHSKLGRPVQIWRYTDTFYVYRFNTKDGKEFRPVSFDGEKWRWKDPKGKLPLYRLDQLMAQPALPVVICEGEKAADAAQVFFPNHITTTTAHGSKSPQKSDLAPLANRAILIWPDNDEPGKKYAATLAKLALLAGASSVHILQVPENLPKGWDAANANGEYISKWQRIEITNDEPKPVPNTSTATPFHLTDMGNTERLVTRYGQNLRYCYSRKQWFVWDGIKWSVDESGLLMKFAKETARSILIEAADTRLETEPAKTLTHHAFKSEHVNRLNAMIQLAQSEVPVLPTELDSYPMLLNCLNGTLDLETGKLREHKRSELHTKAVAIDYNPNAKCPTWLKFLDRIFSGDKELIGFVQHALGYSLTSSIEEQCIFIMHGTGQNGKSTFIDTIQVMMGPYARQAPPDLLLAKTRQQHPTELADLKGTRFVSSVETDRNRKLNENLVKQLTGDAILKARYMRQDFFEFRQEHKIWLATNHLPRVTGNDFAIWRRLPVIRFEVTIPEPEKDKRLLLKLAAELPGILTWAVKGCLAWLRGGLHLPASVINATEEYKTEQDVLSAFFEDCCVIVPGAQVKTGELYKAYVEWCEANGEKFIENNRNFGKQLSERGFKPHKGTKGVRCWLGIGLITTQNMGGVGWHEAASDPITCHPREPAPHKALEPESGVGGMGGTKITLTAREGGGMSGQPENCATHATHASQEVFNFCETIGYVGGMSGDQTLPNATSMPPMPLQNTRVIESPPAQSNLSAKGGNGGDADAVDVAAYIYECVRHGMSEWSTLKGVLIDQGYNAPALEYGRALLIEAGRVSEREGFLVVVG